MNTHSLGVNNDVLAWSFTAILVVWVAAKATEKNPKTATAIVEAARRAVKHIQRKLKKP